MKSFMSFFHGISSRAFAAATVVACVACVAPSLHAQARVLGPALKPYVSVDAPVVALIHAKVIDGTGAPASTDQTVIIRDETITAVGPSSSIAVPSGAKVIDLTGKTIMPGIIGLHDHMYYSGMRFMGVSYPRLFLSAGVTTIRTTGSVDSYAELNIKHRIDSLQSVGPSIIVTGPYLQGAGPYLGPMHPLDGPENARRMVRYWAEEGVTWFKAYTQITHDELAAAIDEAHKHGVKVTAHLCSVGFREAVALGIDQLEHGLLTNSEYAADKRPNACAMAPDSNLYANLDIMSAPVQQTIRDMVEHHVAMTSTLDVFELSAPSRIPADPRVMEALHPDAVKQVDAFMKDAAASNDSTWRLGFKKSMQFEREFVKAGGLLGAGSDPCCYQIIAGYGDQRNFVLLSEAGFSPEETVKIMTANGAKILGIDNKVGTVRPGMQADLIVLAGDPTRTVTDIQKTETVFRRGVGFDSAKLRESVRGLVGLR
ncbi:MAG: amidohydrolase family protein [bacterium]